MLSNDLKTSIILQTSPFRVHLVFKLHPCSRTGPASLTSSPETPYITFHVVMVADDCHHESVITGARRVTRQAADLWMSLAGDCRKCVSASLIHFHAAVLGTCGQVNETHRSSGLTCHDAAGDGMRFCLSPSAPPS